MVPWLRDRKMSERNAQPNMQIAHKLGNLSDTNPTRVSDIVDQSYREALQAIAIEAEAAKTRSPVDQVSAKRRFVQRRSEEIGKVANKVDGVAAKYGTKAVETAISTYFQPSGLGVVSRVIGDISAGMQMRRKLTVVAATTTDAEVAPEIIPPEFG